MVRYRRGLIQDRAREANRIMKLLEGANIKLTSVISNVLSVSGRAMLELLAAGETDPSKIEDGATTNLRAPREQLELAVEGLMRDDQRIMLVTQLHHVDFLTEGIDALNARIEERMRPFDEPMKRLDGIPGIGRRRAEELVAEIGVDMSRFRLTYLCRYSTIRDILFDVNIRFRHKIELYAVVAVQELTGMAGFATM
jgi:transposase